MKVIDRIRLLRKKMDRKLFPASAPIIYTKDLLGDRYAIGDHTYAADEMKNVTAALAEGRGEAAFVHFSAARELDYNFIFSIFSLALACAMT
jgi:hypothetical protein